MDLPWKSLAAIDPNREYVVLLSYLPLKRYSKMLLFFRYSSQINGQFRATAGAIGYAMRAKVFTKEFWTLSVWESDRALMDFVAKVPHSDAMTKISPYMGPTKITRWKAKGSELPPRWDAAMKRAVGAADGRPEIAKRIG
jgi:hypothetical protein